MTCVCAGALIGSALTVVCTVQPSAAAQPPAVAAPQLGLCALHGIGLCVLTAATPVGWSSPELVWLVHVLLQAAAIRGCSSQHAVQLCACPLLMRWGMQ
jgi:hypothetical protein